MLKLELHPDRVLIKITEGQRARLFSKIIKNVEGKDVELFFDIPAGKHFDRSYEQAVQWGVVVAAGENVKDGFAPNDVVILDYLVDHSDKDLVGYHNGDKLLAVQAVTTYYTEDLRTMDQRRFIHRAGDFEFISPVLAILRNNELIARDPYVVFQHQRNVVEKVSLDLINPSTGEAYKFEESQDVLRRTVLAVSPGSRVSPGDDVLIKDADIVDRFYEDKGMHIAFVQDCIAVYD